MRNPSATQTEEDRHGGIQVIARAASVLRALEHHPEGLSLGQLSKSVGLARSTIQRIVGALVAEDLLVAAGPAGGVRIGPGLARLGQSIQSNVADVVRPHLRALGEELGETVDLAVLSGGSAIFIDQVQGSRRLIALSAVGERFPLHCTANGKAILACFAEDDARELALRSAREHPNCGCADLESLMTEICKVRRSHVAFDLEEHAEGICAVGVAILDAFGRPVAISVPVPAQRFKEQKGFLVERLLAMRERLVPLISR